MTGRSFDRSGSRGSTKTKNVKETLISYHDSEGVFAGTPRVCVGILYHVGPSGCKALEGGNPGFGIEVWDPPGAAQSRSSQRSVSSTSLIIICWAHRMERCISSA